MGDYQDFQAVRSSLDRLRRYEEHRTGRGSQRTAESIQALNRIETKFLLQDKTVIPPEMLNALGGD